MPDFRELCAEVLAYHHGEGKYDFSSLKSYDRENASFDAWQDIRQRIKTALVEPESPGNPWHEILDDALVCRFILNEKNENDPRQALNDIIEWEVQCATDPRVSSRALMVPIALRDKHPTEDDCDYAGTCWFWNKDGAWELGYASKILESPCIDFWSHWLPHWALPAPWTMLESTEAST